MDGVSVRTAAARGAQCRRHRFRQYRRSAADLRAGGGAAEAATGARTLADGTGIVSNYQFYFASKKFIAADPKIVDVVLAQLSEVDDWAKGDIRTVAEQLPPRSACRSRSSKSR